MWNQRKSTRTYVVVQVYGLSIERFLNMCRFKHIVFWDVIKNESGFMGNITRDDFLQLKDICRKTETKVRIKKKVGFRFKLFKYRKHYAFAIGIVLSMTLMYVLSLFVWNISFEGNTEYTDSVILKYLMKNGIKPGMMIDEVDCNEVERDVRNGFDQITWVSVQISGTRLIVHIKENSISDITANKKTERNILGERDIVAEKSGVIKKIITRKGTPKVKVGDTVEAGQILVSGIVNICDDSGGVIGSTIVEADSDIMLETNNEYYDELEKQYTFKQYTGRTRTKFLISVPGREIELGVSLEKYKEYDVYTDINVYKLTDSLYLPVSMGVKKYNEYKEITDEYSQEEAQSILNKRMYIHLNELVQNQVQILDNSVKMETDTMNFRYKGSLRLIEPAYTYAEISYPENNNNIDQRKNN